MVKEKYDCIVIGAGNAGLMAALELTHKGKKVLVLESNNVPGGFATSFMRGRFEFEVSLRELLDYGNEERPGTIYKMFQKYGLTDKIKFVPCKEAYHVYCKENHTDYILPFGIQEYVDKMTEYVPKSRLSMKKFFVLAEEVKLALAYMEANKKQIDFNVLQNDYPNFVKVASSSVDKVLDALNMPKKAQDIMTSYWVYFGSSTKNLSFIHFAITLLNYIKFGAVIPTKRSHEISSILADEIEKNGGKIKYLSTVQEILFDNGNVMGVRLSDGKDFMSNHIIYNGSPTLLYGKLIEKELIPKEAFKLTNSRVLGARGFTVFLGLNQSAEDIGLTEYNYFIFHSLNSNTEFEKMSTLKNNSCIATVINNLLPNASPKGTTILTLTSLFFGNAFNEKVTEENYFELKNQIAENIINNFEETTGVNIRNYIEEIEIASPITYARYGGHPDGTIYGYKLTGLDNLLPRIMSQETEEYLKNIHLCGGFDSRANGYSSTYLSGYLAAKSTLLDMKGEE